MITENNYEEYFLLYTDNELNASERSAVEAFVQQHPKYASLLKMFLQTKLMADDSISLADKSSLFKHAGNEISIDNYESYFLLYTDAELSEDDKLETERFVLQHPQLQDEFTLLQQTKLTSETILFPKKERLYKKEKRVLPLYIKPFSIAAAVSVISAFAWLFIPHPAHNETAVIVKPAEAQKPQPKEKSYHVIPDKSTNETQIATSLKDEHKQTTNASLANNIKTKKKSLNKDIPVVPIVQTNITIEKASDEIAVVRKEVKPEAIQQPEVLKPLVEVSNEETSVQPSLEVSDDNIAKTAVYKEINTDEDNHTLYVGSLQLNKAKVNGFLKTASHLFGNKSKQNIE